MRIAMVWSALLPLMAAAQDDPHARVRERWRMMRMWKLTDSLALDEATGSKLFPLLNRYDDQEDSVHRELRDTQGKLRDALKSGKPDGKKLTEWVDRIVKAHERLGALRQERIRESRKLLTPVQQAKLALLLPRIERHFHRMVEKAMHGRGGPGDPGRGPRGPGPGGPGRGFGRPPDDFDDRGGFDDDL
jgi:Spy/CpxP family protein refolding chaperone